MENIMQVIRREFAALEGEEILLPLIGPSELWTETGRDQVLSDQLTYFKDKQDKSLVLSPSHEEACIALARQSFNDVQQLPSFLYQFQSKFRDEEPHAMGLVRAREFLMADAFSLHATEVGLNNFFPKIYQTFQKIFSCFGLDVIIAPGAAEFSAGDQAYEILVPARKGEHTLISCKNCDYSANQDVAVGLFKTKANRLRPLEVIPGLQKSTPHEVQSAMGVPPERLIHCPVYVTVNGVAMAVLRTDQHISRDKLSRCLGEPVVRLARDAELLELGLVPSFVSPLNLDSEERERWGLRIVVDNAVAESTNLIMPGNQDGLYYANANFGRDFGGDVVGDIARVDEHCRCYHCGGELASQKVEKLAHLYRMGDSYSRSMHFSLVDERGDEIFPHLGSYGLGIGRLMATVAEYRSDHRSLCWPLSIAPYKALLVVVGRGKTIQQIAENVYEKIQDFVLWDDRKIPVTEKFRDADRLGIPIRLVISAQSLEDGNLMFSHRLLSRPTRIPFHRVSQKIEDLEKLEQAVGPQKAPGLVSFREESKGER